MHPHIISDRPGKCPICGMDLVLVEKGQRQARPAGVSDSAHAEVFVSPERQQLIGVRTTKAENRELTLTVRAVGRIAYDPELYNTLVEYKEALANFEKVKASPMVGVRERAEALVRSSELRLKLLGIGFEDIDQFLDASHSGLLLPETIVWVYADIYEYEAGLVKPDQTADISSPALPHAQFQGTVKTVDPILNAATRTLRVRIAVENKEKLLKPEMFVDVKIKIPLGTRLAIPEEAVVRSGETPLVFLSRGDGHFEPRKVRLGYEAAGWYEVLDGLEAGDTVVNSANFLIDSESRLQAAVKGFKSAES
ncbi:MAG: efflux RND transporter periplasmic adaptor subunit [Candidatus Omnitrophica bacterium]|nr:efflux RND transporter periplasmic adaptor subunit [Candidatus Omnitrophota bacterium]